MLKVYKEAIKRIRRMRKFDINMMYVSNVLASTGECISLPTGFGCHNCPYSCSNNSTVYGETSCGDVNGILFPLWYSELNKEEVKLMFKINRYLIRNFFFKQTHIKRFKYE